MNKIKKIVAIMLAVLMIASVSAVGVYAAEAADGQLKVTIKSNLASSVEKTYDIAKDKVVVSFKLQSALKILNSNGAVTYDKDALALESFVLNEKLLGQVNNTNLVGAVKFSNTDLSGADFSKEDDFIVATFTAIKGGETEVALDMYDLTAIDGSKDVDFVDNSKVVSDKFTSVCSTVETKEDPVVPTPATIKLNASSKKLSAGKTYTIKVEGTSAKAAYTSNKKSVATVSSKGVVTALKKGTAKITVKVDGKKLTFTAKVTSSPKITKVGKKAYSAKTVYSIKKKATLTVKLSGKAKAVNNTYKTSKKSVAKVTSKKTATSVKIKGLKKGTATITIKVNNTKTFKIKVKVK